MTPEERADRAFAAACLQRSTPAAEREIAHEIREAEAGARSKAYLEAAKWLEDAVDQHAKEVAWGDHGGEEAFSYEAVLDIAKFFRARAKEATGG